MSNTPSARRVSLDLPAGQHERFAPSVASNLIGQELDLDERIAGLSGLITQSLSADERGLWTRARVVDAEVVQQGMVVRVTVEAI